MTRWGIVLGVLLSASAIAGQGHAQAPPLRDSQPLPKPAPEAIQHGAQPNAEEVRPGSPSGNMPSAAVGNLQRDPVERRILGLPITAALVIAAVLVVLVALGAFVIPGISRRRMARGGGTYGPRR
jgi:hypothetical protein